MQGADDGNLVKEFQAGSNAAFDELQRRWEPRMFQLACKTIGPQYEDQARDLTQDAFLRAYRALKKFRGESKFSTWVHTITRNVCVDWIKHQQRTPPTTPLPESPAGPFIGLTIDDLERRTMLKTAVDTVMATLTPHERTVTRLMHREGLSRRQIAKRLGWPEGTVATRMRSAFTKLRQGLQEFKDEPR
jgi:RNA polymerase sigma-70 factor (ECF subfamily)